MVRNTPNHSYSSISIWLYTLSDKEIDQKVTDPVPGETALETLCKDVTDILRLEARPHSCRQEIRTGSAIAASG